MVNAVTDLSQLFESKSNRRKMNKIIAITVIIFVTCVSLSFAEEVTVGASGARLYAEPDNSSLILDVVAGGIMVTVNETSGDWTRITLPSSAETGWVEARYLEKNTGRLEYRPPVAESYAANTNLNRDQVDRLRDRINGISGTLNRLDRRLDQIITPAETMAQQENEIMKPEVPLGTKRVSEMPQDKWPAEEMKPQDEESLLSDEAFSGVSYRWSNRFVMGRNFDNGEQCYGVGISRRMDDRGIIELDFESTYAFSNEKGSVYDYLDGSAGVRFNYRPDLYRIYPFIGVMGGVRYYINTDKASDSNDPIWGALLGLTADVNSVFSLTIETRGYFIQAQAKRRNEGRVAFFAAYHW